jgi:hypothetical protein
MHKIEFIIVNEITFRGDLDKKESLFWFGSF